MNGVAQSRQAALVELNAVVAVATHKSFRRAAVELGLSPSAVSHAVAALEERLGVRLFHRTTRSVALTEAGERFIQRVRPALSEIAKAMDDANEFRDKPAGVLRINASEAGAQLVFAPVVLPFLKRFPDMSIDLVTEGRLVDIVAEGFDAGIRLEGSVPREMIAVPFGPAMRWVVVGSPRYFAKRSKPRAPADLLEHACIRTRLPSGAIFRWELEKRDETMALDVKGPLTLLFAEWPLALQAALAGLGLAYLTESSVAAHLEAGRLVRVLDDWTPPSPGFCLYYPHQKGSAGLRAFIEQLRSASFR